MGRDNENNKIESNQHVSIHAPAWGATKKADLKKRQIVCFNPRARMGRDITTAINNRGRRVSIHAPAWGATLDLSPALKEMLVSIHAPAWGAT